MPVAQLDRVSDYESEGWPFESARARFKQILMRSLKVHKKAQVLLEYLIVFNVVTFTILFGANQYIKPAMVKLIQRAGEMIEREADRLTRHYE